MHWPDQFKMSWLFRAFLVSILAIYFASIIVLQLQSEKLSFDDSDLDVSISLTIKMIRTVFVICVDSLAINHLICDGFWN